ncbi:hypothetical protein DM02DRAFT_636221 [Periconia macrospinosa]|uniref:Uncharacterized protein n=1 Tax=Periconia macrospinosa TaxID=97972 RepID=A0A2V1CZT1_9PLEO|nr:hypothetical protein DM02DRAFT_636221 [Periconia macrospinosa]
MSLSPADLKYQQDHINDTLQPNIYAACFICLPAAFIAVGLRFLSRPMTASGFGKDDWTIVLALICTTGFVVTCIWGSDMSDGQPPGNLEESKYAWIILKDGALAKALNLDLERINEFAKNIEQFVDKRFKNGRMPLED